MNIEIPEAVKTWSQFGHPILMWVLLGLTVYAMYSGWQIRRIRSVDATTKKELIKQKFNDKHYQIGSICLALMILGTVGAMAVTYINNGKLFVGSHLLAGLSMTTMMGVSASLVPWMRKGNNIARYSHISLNITLLGLFGWQAVTGMQIVQKILARM